jgi:hypothetical protein
MSNIIILKVNEKLCGIYNSEDLVDNFIKSCLNCNFIKKNDKIVLQYYQINSFILIDTKIINLNDKSFNNTQIVDSNNLQITDLNDVQTNESNNHFNLNCNSYEDFSDSDASDISSIDATHFLNMKKKERENFNKLIELGQEKIELQSQINKLNLDKKKLNEKKIKYDCDIELYEKFKNLKKENQSFVIPELFINKFNLFTILEENNDLNFESFNDKYVDETLKTSYFDLFESQEYAYKLPVPENFNEESIDDLKNVAF